VGAIVGRVSNRIRDAKFELNGKGYELEKNDGNNIVHSGSTCLSHVIKKFNVAYTI
jgi:aldose 1-epimerase